MKWTVVSVNEGIVDDPSSVFIDHVEAVSAEEAEQSVMANRPEASIACTFKGEHFAEPT